MKTQFDHSALDAMSTDELHDLLDAVMVKLRHRDAQELKKNLVSKSQRLTLPEHVASHLTRQ